MEVDDEVTDETTMALGIEGVAVECMVYFKGQRCFGLS